MILRITAESLENKLGAFFGKIGKFFMDIWDSFIGTLEKFMPKEAALILLVVLGALLAVYLFTQKINK